MNTSIPRQRFHYLWLMLLIAAMGAIGFAQVNRGTITGIVNDPGGAVVPSVNVIATHVETGTSSTTNTTDAGVYTLPALQIGVYRVEFESASFKRTVREQVTVTSGATVRLDVALELGAVTESVTVSADTAPIETETTRVATTITTKLVKDLPLLVNGGIRNPLTLARMAPETRLVGGQFRIGGGQNAGWDMLMDGMPLTSASSLYQTDRAPLSSVPIDAIEEFTVETTGMKAEFGRAMGAVTFGTKSGTNAIHGNLFENLRNNVFDANGFFNNAESRPRGTLKQHDYGGTVGGPVYVPKIYDGRNKSFFFASYQGFRNRAGNTNPPFLTIPTAANYNGDFSTWTRNGNFVQIYDPGSTRPNPSGSGFVRDQFAGNLIPANRFSEVAQRVIAVRPDDFLPNVDSRTRGLRDADVQNYVRYEGSSINPWDKGSLRLDHQLNNSNRFSFLYLKGRSADEFGPDGPTGLPLPFNGAAVQERRNQSYRVSWDLAKAHFLNTFRISYQKERGTGTVLSGLDPEARWNEKFQIGNTPGPDRQFPQFSFTGYSGWGGAFWGGDAGGNVNLTNDVTFIRDRHNIKAGFFYARDRWDGYGQHRPNGSFGFSQQATSIPLDNSQNTGNAFASFLLGYASTWGLETPRLVRQIYNYYGGYIQDDWKVTSKLTINAGLRYEFTAPIQGGAYVGLSSWEDLSSGTLDGFTNFDPYVPNPGAGGRLGAAVFSGNGPGRTPGDVFDAYPWAFGPRLGLAYRVTDKTVVRAYGARTFAAVKTTGGSTHFQGFILNTTVNTTDQSVNDLVRIDNGLPAWNAPPFIDPTISNNQNIDFWQRGDSGRPPEYYTWNVDIQHEFAASMVFTASYTGTKGTYLSSSLNRINQLEYKYLTQYGRTLLNSPATSAAARAAGIGLPYAGFNSTVLRALTPYPQYLNILTNQGQPGSVGERAGNSTYHAMTLKLDKRYGNGLTLLGSYVFSKQLSNAESGAIGGGGALDHYNKGLNKGLAGTDQTHLYRLAFTYDLPFGRSGAFDFGRVANAIVGNWTVSGFLSYESGFPMSVTHNFNPINTGSRVFITSYEGWRAPVSGDKFDPYKDLWLDAGQFNQGIPQSVLETTWGNAGVNNPKLRSPWNLDESLGVARNFNITERWRFTLRGEAFNVLNRVRWGNPTTNLSSGNFGLVRTQGNTPRRFQLALRMDF